MSNLNAKTLHMYGIQDTNIIIKLIKTQINVCIDLND